VFNRRSVAISAAGNQDSAFAEDTRDVRNDERAGESPALNASFQIFDSAQLSPVAIALWPRRETSCEDNQGSHVSFEQQESSDFLPTAS
jgi:hypothetical protein